MSDAIQLRRGYHSIILTAGLMLTVALASCQAPVGHGSVSASKPSSPPIRCPRSPLSLPRAAIAPTTLVAIRYAHRKFPEIHRIIATLAARAPESPRGGEVKHYCGENVWQRTIEVDMYFPGLPASLAELDVFVSRFEGGYKVWGIAHYP